MSWWRGWTLVFTLLFTLYSPALESTIDLLGIFRVAKPKCRNFQEGAQTRVFVKLSKCHDIANGNYRCDDVLFIPQEIKANVK